MFLHKLLLNPRCRDARRDLSNPYELHSTLCRAFSTPEQKCPGGTFLWRLEGAKDRQTSSEILVQSSIIPDWSRINVKDWFATMPHTPLDLVTQLNLKELQLGQSFRFRLRANPSVSRGGKRVGLFQNTDQIEWLVNKGVNHGFKLSQVHSFAMENQEHFDLMISQEKMLRGKQRNGHEISVYSVQYDGILIVSDIDKFLFSLMSGIGHGKAMGLGLLSVVPLR